MTQTAKLSYRVVKSSGGGCWEVLCDGNVLADGSAPTSVKARAKALLACTSISDGHFENDPAGYNRMTTVH
jgi:hypothetical protein